MKRTFLISIVSALSTITMNAAEKPDSLLLVLDRAIADRAIYSERKEAMIEELKRQKGGIKSPEERYRINQSIISSYESFNCDSAELYINENIRIAEELHNRQYLTDSKLSLAFVYSLSGLFVQAVDLFRSFDYESLEVYQKVTYCWNYIRYYENLIKYTDNPGMSADYGRNIVALRDNVIHLLQEGTEMYQKEKAFKLQAEGNYRDALDILTGVFNRQEPDTHSYAMLAMSLAKIYGLAGDEALENKFLKLAAITDIRFAVKENEALLTLAMNLFRQGDINRSYNYISAALSDANSYNSRFKNTVIARVQPVIESNYLYKIEKQKRNLRLYAILISVFVVALIIMITINFRQIKIVSKARRHLREMNSELIALNKKLGEANTVKEKYIGYFMNQCSQYINKLYAYRKEVNHKIKSGQVDRLYKPSASEHEKEIEELYKNFDEAFLKLYPDFVAEFNSLLEPGVKYELDGNQLNTELRIFALIRLGITNVNQIAEFLQCSLQTIYNYKSKVKGKSRKDIANFEEEVRKLGLTVSQTGPI